MELILGLCVGIVFFLCTITAYCLGLKHSKQLSNNQIPKININPMKAIVEAIENHETKKEETKAKEELDEIFSYTRESALEAIKKER